MPQDREWFNPREGESHEEHFKRMRDWHNSPDADQYHAASYNEAEHAEKWFAGTRHLFDPATQSVMERSISAAKRGMVTHDELKDRLIEHSNGVYTGADTPVFKVPDHLSDQFIRENDGRKRWER